MLPLKFPLFANEEYASAKVLSETPFDNDPNAVDKLLSFWEKVKPNFLAKFCDFDVPNSCNILTAGML